MKLIKKIISVAAAAVMACCMFGCESKPHNPVTPPEKIYDDERVLTDAQYTASQICGVDALGRTVTVGDENSGRDVGLFYFLWLGAHGNKVYDVSELEKESPEEILDPESEVSPAGTYHFWGKPLYGYYHSADPWVLTRHVELFTAAGIDFLIFDTSNGPTYENVVDNLLDVLEKFRLQGFPVPKIAFMTNSGTVQTVNRIYDRYYSPSAPKRYPELWYLQGGKPFILANIRYFDFDDPKQEEMADFFTMRVAQWPNGIADDDYYPWIEWNYPQPDHNGVMSVSVAQHVSGKMSQKEGNWGRGFSYSDWCNSADRVAEGSNFQGQWDTVFKVNSNDTDVDDVKSVFVTGWNEWIAIKKYEGGEVFYVDQYNAEYSRDIEMDSGVYGDNYYMQLASNVRKYKYSAAKHYRHKGATVDFGDLSLSAWSAAKTYLDFNGDSMARDYRGYNKKTTYTDNTNRNDIVNVKVVCDGEYAYFRIECAEDITERADGDASFMNLWINTDLTQGYKYAVNRVAGKLSRLEGGEYKAFADVQTVTNGNVMAIAVKLADIGVDPADPGFIFKVTDNVDVSNPMNYYIQGDSAPIGRLSYAYGYIK